MINFIIDQLIAWWQFTFVGAVIIVAWIIDRFDGTDESRVRINFKYTEMPDMQPIPIPTKGRGFWWAIWTWIMGVRKWKINKDFHYEIKGTAYVIPKGFEFDGASVPKFLAAWLSPVGVLLMGGLVHDYAYRYGTLLKKNKKETGGVLTRVESDKLFRDINIEINGFFVMNYLAYWALLLGAWPTWNGHRKRNLQPESLK